MKVNLARIYYQRGRLKQAISTYKSVPKGSPYWFTAQEEYGLRCLLSLARAQAVAAAAGDELLSVPLGEIARAEGLSEQYTGKLFRILVQAGLTQKEAGDSAHGGRESTRRGGSPQAAGGPCDMFLAARASGEPGACSGRSSRS